MIDYIYATKHLCYKDTFSKDHLQLEATYISGWNRYSLQGCKELEVSINDNLNIMKIKGSIAYYYQGHNFVFDNQNFVEAIEYIAKLLKCNLWDSEINEFEFGTIIQVDSKPKEYIQRHRETKGLTMNEIPKSKGCFRYYEDKYVSLKMYDSGKNIKHKQGLTMRKIIEDAGWNPESNYLKWEVHYKKPHLSLNKGVGLVLSDLVNPKWCNRFKLDLLEQYKRLIPMKSIQLPNDKKECSSADIAIQELAEIEINDGYTIPEIKKNLYNRINNYSKELLSDNDKKARKRQLKNLLDRLRFEDKSKWDLYYILFEKVNPNTS